MKRATVLLFFCCVSILSAAAPKAPRLRVFAIDSVTGLPLAGVRTNIVKVTKNEKKGETFIFSVTVGRSNYNTLIQSVPVDPSMAGKVVVSTQRLEPMILGGGFREAGSSPLAISNGMLNAADSYGTNASTTNVSTTNAIVPVLSIPETGTVRGVVRNSDKSLLPGVVVRLVREDGSVRSEMTTGSDGAYTFTNLEIANFKVVLAGGREISSRVIPLPVRPTVRIALPVVVTNTVSDFPRAAFKVIPGLNRTVEVDFGTTNGVNGAIAAFKTPSGFLYATAQQTVATDRSLPDLVWRERISLDGTRLSASAGRQLFEDGLAFDLYLFTVGTAGAVHPVPEVFKVTTKDSVPPPMPRPGRFVLTNGMLSLSWERVGPESDTEGLVYRVYSRGRTNDRLVHATKDYTRDRTTQLLIPLPKGLEDSSNLVLAVTAVDRSGNESEWSDQSREFRTDGVTVFDFVLERKNPPIEPPPPPAPPKPVRKPTPAERFVRAGYILSGPKSVLSYKGKNFRFRPNEGVSVRNGARLTIENSVLSAAGDGRWKGITVESGGVLILKNCLVLQAETALRSSGQARVVLENTKVLSCRTGLSAEDSRIEVRGLRVARSADPVAVKTSAFLAERLSVESNSSGPVFISSEVRCAGGQIRANGTALRLKGGTAFFKSVGFSDGRMDGILLESGHAEFERSSFTRNAANGVACVPGGLQDPVFRECDFDSNRLYAVRGAGRLFSCYAGRNNGAAGADTTPDRGSPDGIRDSFSNASIMQIYGVDSVKSMALKKNLSEE